jgi:Na+/H+-dicarboxylate symporter/ABC-type amino acid transport substrate-binding protein
MNAGIPAIARPVQLFLRQNLALQVLEGLLVGLVVGLLLPAANLVLAPIGQIFLHLFQMPVIPFLSVSLITGVGRLELSQASRLLSRAGLVLLGLWAMALGAVMILPLGFPAWREASLFKPSLLQAPEQLNLLNLFIPINPFSAYAQTQIPAVVLFSLALGIALIAVPQRQQLIDVLDRIAAALLGISGFVARFTPLGVLAITASTTQLVAGPQLPRLLVYLVLLSGVALLFALLVLPLLVRSCTGIRVRALLRSFRTPLMIAFATANLLVVLPLLVNQGKQLLAATLVQQGPDQAERRQAIEQRIALPIEVLTPLALVFPDMGRVISISFVPFAGWLTGNPLPGDELPGFLLTGLASTFLEGVLAMTFLLDRMGLPSDLVELYLALDQIAVARVGTLLACMSVITLVLIGTWLVVRPARRPSLSAANLMRILAPAAALVCMPLYIGASRLVFERLPAPSNPVRRQLETQGFALARTRAVVDARPTAEPQAGNWTTMQQRGLIRYCVHRRDYPMAFRNASGRLVGADVEMGLLFAEQMGMAARFVEIDPMGRPGPDTPSAIAALQRGLCDLVLSTDVIVPEQGGTVLYARPTENFGIGLMLNGNRLADLRSWKDLQSALGLRIGLEASSRFLKQWFAQRLPRAAFLTDQALPELFEALAQGRLDAVLVTAQQGAAWNVIYPRFSLLVPQPAISFPASRQLPPQAHALARVWDSWVLIQATDGSREKVYRHWVEGE